MLGSMLMQMLQYRLVSAMQPVKISDSQRTSPVGMSQIVQSSYQSHFKKLGL